MLESHCVAPTLNIIFSLGCSWCLQLCHMEQSSSGYFWLYTLKCFLSKSSNNFCFNCADCPKLLAQMSGYKQKCQIWFYVLDHVCVVSSLSSFWFLFSGHYLCSLFPWRKISIILKILFEILFIFYHSLLGLWHRSDHSTHQGNYLWFP